MNFLRLSFLVALAGTLGSLYFSEIQKFPPCVLCWYQRVALYPLVLIFGAAIWTEDDLPRKYALPLIVAGLAIAGYHNLVYYGFISEALTPCTGGGVSCSSRQLELFGFITIPLLSLAGFATLSVLSILSKKGHHETK